MNVRNSKAILALISLIAIVIVISVVIVTISSTYKVQITAGNKVEENSKDNTVPVLEVVSSNHTLEMTNKINEMYSRGEVLKLVSVEHKANRFYNIRVEHEDGVEEEMGVWLVEGEEEVVELKGRWVFLRNIN